MPALVFVQGIEVSLDRGRETVLTTALAVDHVADEPPVGIQAAPRCSNHIGHTGNCLPVA
jgi:hypothetical protein